MEQKRFDIERRDLSAITTGELKCIAHTLHRASELVADAQITSDEAALAELEDAINADLSGISAILARIEKRISNELAHRP